MRGHPGNELQVIHLLLLRAVFVVLVVHPAFHLIKGETLQGKKRPDHVLADSFRLFLRSDPELAVDMETPMVPAEDFLYELEADELFPK